MDSLIFLDNASTTKIDGRVLEVMLPYMQDHFGNASSLHQLGVQQRDAVYRAKCSIASHVGCLPEEVIFTSSGTESNNLAIKGVAFANRHKGNHIIVSSIEHDCILNACKWLETQGFFVTYIPVDTNGFVDVEFLKRCINPKTILVSVMHANNEIGTLQPIAEIGAICHERNVYFHSDICQSFGKVNVDTRCADLLSLNSHKMYGPKGVGALIVRKNVVIDPLLHGGGQEGGLRSSTENVEGIVGFAKAVDLCFEELEREQQRIASLQALLMDRLTSEIEGVYFNGDLKSRLPHNVNFCISGLEGEAIKILLLLDDQGVALSSGSACSANSGSQASHVLQAIGRNQFEARGAIRVSIGRYNTIDDIEKFVHILKSKVKNLNSIFSIS